MGKGQRSDPMAGDRAARIDLDPLEIRDSSAVKRGQFACEGKSIFR